MTRFIIHVGPHKTGTTYLQSCFTNLRSDLSRSGILFPSLWQWKQQGGHAHLPERIIKRDAPLAAEFEDLRNGPHEAVLISSEGLSSLGLADIEALKRLTGDAVCDIVFYVRRFSELLPSSWQEEVKHGRWETLPTHLFKHISYPGVSSVLGLSQKITKFVSVFGGDHVKLVSYSNIMDNGDDLLQHFGNEVLSRPLSSVQMSRRPNTSMSPVDTEVVRVLNGLHRLHGGKPDSKVRLAYFQCAFQDKEEIVAALKAAVELDLTTLRLDDQMLSLHTSHQKALRNHRALMINPLPDGSFYAPRKIDLPYAGADYQAMEGVASNLQRLYSHITGCEAPHSSDERTRVEVDSLMIEQEGWHRAGPRAG